MDVSEYMNEYDKELLSKNLDDALARIETLMAERAMLDALYEKQRMVVDGTRKMLVENRRSTKSTMVHVASLQHKLSKV